MEGMATDALWLVALLAAPLLGVALVIAVVTGYLQASTQLTEPALSFIPKLIGLVVVLALLGGWMGDRLVDFTAAQLTGINENIE